MDWKGLTMSITWSDVVAHYDRGDSLKPLVGDSKLAVDSVDDEQICVRQRLWRACLKPDDLRIANEILAGASTSITPIRFAEMMRARLAGGTDVTTDCTRVPNLMAVVLFNMGVFGGPGSS